MKNPRRPLADHFRSVKNPRRPSEIHFQNVGNPRRPLADRFRSVKSPRRPQEIHFQNVGSPRRPLAARFQACAGMPCLRDEKIKELTGATLLIGLVFSFFYINFYWHPRVRIRINEREIPSLLEYFSLRVQEVVSVTFDTTS